MSTIYFRKKYFS